jgi:hypothetical protein
VCCQGTNCTSGISSCECQQNGGTFKAGRQCQQSNVCTCPGQPNTQVSVCETCPPGCTSTPCDACKPKQTINLKLSRYDLNPMPEQYSDLYGDYTLNHISGGCLNDLWIHEEQDFYLAISSAGIDRGTGSTNAGGKYGFICGFGCKFASFCCEGWECEGVDFFATGQFPVGVAGGFYRSLYVQYEVSP